MGGAKKKPIAKAERGQVAGGEEEKPAPKKSREKQAEKTLRAAGVSRLDENQAVQALMPLKAITIYGAARVLGIRASDASQMLRNLEGKGQLKRVAGYSGHYVYSRPAVA